MTTKPYCSAGLKRRRDSEIEHPIDQQRANVERVCTTRKRTIQALSSSSSKDLRNSKPHQSLNHTTRESGLKKRKLDCDATPRKRSKGPSHKLSETNLAALDRQNGLANGEVMSQSDSFTSQGAKKRLRARRESILDLDGDTASTRSQKTSCTHFEYRSKVLGSAKLDIVYQVVEDSVKHIAERTITPEHEARVRELATEMLQAVAGTVKGGNREDDCLEPVQRSLERLGGDTFVYTRKAGMLKFGSVAPSRYVDSCQTLIRGSSQPYSRNYGLLKTWICNYKCQ